MEIEELIRAVYLTLLHSMWQGAAIAAATGLIIISTRNSSSTWRYNLLAGSMLFFVLCTLITFFQMINTPLGVIPVESDGSLSYASPIQLTIPTNTLDEGFLLLSSYSNSIVLGWFIIICFKGIQLALELQRISELKTRQISDPGTKWTALISILAARMGITTIVRFAESGLTSIPLTVGYCKPVILVPVSMLAAIPLEQIEAILLHELAHIKRRDYLINIFQAVVEVLFFFNPAIWWLSSHLRAERENCCDDLAIANSSSKTEYVRALITFEEYRTQHPPLSVAFAGPENTLLKRTKRIIYNQNDHLNPMEKFILTSSLVVSGLLCLAFTDGAKEQISKTLKPVVSTISEASPMVEKAVEVRPDTIPASSIREISINKGGQTTFNAVHKGKAYRILIKDDKITDLYIDNTKIAEEKLSNYTNEIIEIVRFNEAVNLYGTDEERPSDQGAFTALDDFDPPKIAIAFDGISSKLTALTPLLAAIDTLVPGSPATPRAPGPPAALPTTPAFPATPPTPPLAPETELKVQKAIKVKPAKALKIKPLKAVKGEVAPSIEIHPMPAVKPVIHVTPKVSPAKEVSEAPRPE